MSKCCELARSIHLCNVVLTFLVCEHDTILMILMIAIVYTTYMAILKALAKYWVSTKYFKYGYLQYKLIAVCMYKYQY